MGKKAKISESLEHIREQLAEIAEDQHEEEEDDEEGEVDLDESEILRLNTPERLNSYYCEYATEHSFARGQLVGWKPHMRNRMLPLLETPAVVVDVLQQPVLANDIHPGFPTFRERLDIVLGVIDTDGEFMLFHYDSRRFQPFNPKKEG